MGKRSALFIKNKNERSPSETFCVSTKFEANSRKRSLSILYKYTYNLKIDSVKRALRLAEDHFLNLE